MFSLFKKKEPQNLIAFASGKIIPIEEVPDPVFASKTLGNGLAIDPRENIIVSPCDGVVTVAMTDTKHAVAITTPTGLEILIHEGLETVSMGGEGFELYVKEGQQLKVGDKLIGFNKELIKEKGCAPICVMAISNEEAVNHLEYRIGTDAKQAETVIATYETK